MLNARERASERKAHIGAVCLGTVISPIGSFPSILSAHLSCLLPGVRPIPQRRRRGFRSLPCSCTRKPGMLEASIFTAFVWESRVRCVSEQCGKGSTRVHPFGLSAVMTGREVSHGLCDSMLHRGCKTSGDVLCTAGFGDYSQHTGTGMRTRLWRGQKIHKSTS